MSIAPQDLVEAALSVATLPCVSSVRERTEANLRWANNALDHQRRDAQQDAHRDRDR